MTPLRTGPAMELLEEKTIARLLAAHGRGDASAVERLAERLRPLVLRFARRSGTGVGERSTFSTTRVARTILDSVRMTKSSAGARRALSAALGIAMADVIVALFRRRRGPSKPAPSPYDGLDLPLEYGDVDHEALRDGLTELERSGRSGRRAREVVLHRYYLGLDARASADALGIPEEEAERDWRYAKAFLSMRLRARNRVLETRGGGGR